MRFNLRQNLYLKIFSVILAFVCWYVVRSEEERVRDFAVPLEYVGLPAGLDLSGRVVDGVAIRLRAPEPFLGTITEDRLSARIDLARATPGEQYIPLTPEMIRAPGGAQVERITPDLVKVRIDRRTRREVPVVAEFSGLPPPGFEKVRSTIEPAMATIEGPANEVEKVTRALTGTILLDAETTDFVVEATPIPDAPSWSHVRVVSPQGPVRVRVTIGRVPAARPGASAPSTGGARPGGGRSGATPSRRSGDGHRAGGGGP